MLRMGDLEFAVSCVALVGTLVLAGSSHWIMVKWQRPIRMARRPFYWALIGYLQFMFTIQRPDFIRTLPGRNMLLTDMVMACIVIATSVCMIVAVTYRKLCRVGQGGMV